MTDKYTQKQSTNHLLMIKPLEFYANEQTSHSNHYQSNDFSLNQRDEILEKAIIEFESFKKAIEEKGIKISSYEGSTGCPDHIFPNWFITFEDKTMQLFSMLAINRRAEKKPHIINDLRKTYKLTDDLSNFEEKGLFLESTSSMVFDRVNNVVYAGISERTSKELLEKWCHDNNFKLVQFETISHTGEPIYHTDVFMYIGSSLIGICPEIIHPIYKEKVMNEVNKNHFVLLLEKDQLLDFCGNALEARNENGELFLIMSERAYKGLHQEQIAIILDHFKDIIFSDLQTIEKYGGGSARCMLAELF